jgi:hypothetical protein
MKSVLQDWVMNLGLRHQGTILTAIRGCDTAPKNDPSKMLVRCFRDVVLNPFVGDAAKAATFIERVSHEELLGRMYAYRKNLDHYPHHYVTHLMHAVEIVGYKHPDNATRNSWRSFYRALCHSLHINYETEEQLDARLNADEQTFAARDRD